MSQSEIARRDFFYVGGESVGAPGQEVMHGQMYVEKLMPREARRPYPLVLFHGAGQTATNWLGTPDGRPGWAEYFAREGYTIYLIDQPARGRSACSPRSTAS
jgi:pimeloyl-ACP methyl ester carboxylesterase